MQAGHADEIAVARRMHVAQFADRLLLRDQTRCLDRGEGFAGQGNGGRTEHQEAQRVVDPVFPGKTLWSLGPGVAGVGGAEVQPDQRVRRRRRALLQKQLHAAMTDLMAGGADEDEVAGQFLRRDDACQRQKIGDARPALANAIVPARHRRGHDNGRPRAGAEPGNDIAAGDVPLIAPGDIECDRHARGHRALEHGSRLCRDHHHRHRPGRILLRDVIGKTVVAGIADHKQDRLRPARRGLRDRRAVGRAEIGAAVIGQFDP